MPSKKTRKKVPLTKLHSQGGASHKSTQRTISSFHTLLKRQSSLRQRLETAINDEERTKLSIQLQQIENGIQEAGGLASYQEASKLGQSVDRGGDSAKVLIGWLREEGVHHRTLLEVGALKPDNYASCSKWISNTPIDLHSQHPEILEQDFFLRPLPDCDGSKFDVISCSLVLNFVPDPRQRGRMLQLMHDHLRPVPTSRLFLVLPSPCVHNSRYLDVQLLVGIMDVIGFKLISERRKDNGRLGYWLWAWTTGKPAEAGFTKKRIINDGSKRNNFAILL